MIDITRIKDVVHSTIPGSSLDTDIQKEPDSISETEFSILAPRWNRMLGDGGVK